MYKKSCVVQRPVLEMETYCLAYLVTYSTKAQITFTVTRAEREYEDEI
jgi:hypothetical protein